MDSVKALEGLIIKGIAGFYYIKSGDAVYRCRARGVFKQRNITPAVGDMVKMRPAQDDDDGVVTEILPRKNSFSRPFVVNVDVFVVVISAARPAPVFSVIDKLLVMAEKNDTDIVVCINKCDLADASQGEKGQKARGNIEKVKDIYEPIYPVVCLSRDSEDGLDELKILIEGKKAALAGPSGVGKSTILNRLMPDAGAETGNISEKSQRGKNTTRHSELFTIDGGKGTMIFDTPGFTSFDITEVEEDELGRLFPEIARRLGSCKYNNCRHVAEPGCGVLKAVENNEISRSRYESYRNMLDEIEEARQY